MSLMEGNVWRPKPRAIAHLLGLRRQAANMLTSKILVLAWAHLELVSEKSRESLHRD